MLHPYSIFFKAMWETPPAAHDDAIPEPTRRMRWRLWRSYETIRRAAAERPDTGSATTTPIPTTPPKAPRGRVAG